MSKYIYTKNSSLERPKNVSKQQYISASYGDIFEYEPIDNPVKIYHFSGSSMDHEDHNVIRSLKNIINSNNAKDSLYDYNIIYDNPVNILAFNSLHLGSGLKKGSININIYLLGSIIDSASDFRENGILYNKNDEKIGVILYNEGFIILTNTSSLSEDEFYFSSSYQEFYDSPRWIHSFLNSNESLYYDMSYSTKNEVPSNTYFVFADKNNLNHSNNTTYIESGSYWSIYNNNFFVENDKIKIKNTIQSPFVNGNANFEKQTFITRIGLHDSDKNIIGIASLSNPIKKLENREFLFKLKIDF